MHMHAAQCIKVRYHSNDVIVCADSAELVLRSGVEMEQCPVEKDSPPRELDTSNTFWVVRVSSNVFSEDPDISLKVSCHNFSQSELSSYL